MESKGPHVANTVIEADYQGMITRRLEKYEVLENVRDERRCHRWAATKTNALKYGGQTVVAKATGLLHRIIYQELVRAFQECGRAVLRWTRKRTCEEFQKRWPGVVPLIRL